MPGDNIGTDGTENGSNGCFTDVKLMGKFKLFDKFGSLLDKQELEPGGVAHGGNRTCGVWFGIDTDVMFNLGVNNKWTKLFIVVGLWPADGKVGWVGRVDSNAGGCTLPATDTGNSSGTWSGMPLVIWVWTDSESDLRTVILGGKNERHGKPGGVLGEQELNPNVGKLEWDVVCGFETGDSTESLFNVGLIDGHNGCKGVGLQAGNNGDTGANDESKSTRFFKSELTSEVEGGTVTGGCRTGAVIVGPHDILGKTFDEPEFEPGNEAQEEDMVCGCGIRTGTGVKLEVGKTVWDSDVNWGFDELLHAEEDKQSLTRNFKRAGL